MGIVRHELGQLIGFERRHKVLLVRITVVLVATFVIALLGAVAIYFAERHAKGTGIHSYGDALFFAGVQLLTVSSQLPNPFTPLGRVIDVVLEVWAVLVVAGSAGAIAAFFQAPGDR